MEQAKELYQKRYDNLMKAIRRDNPEWVPTLTNPGGAMAAWAGKRIVDLYYDPAAYSDAMNKLFGVINTDATLYNGCVHSPKMEQAFRGETQMRFGNDGNVEQHVAMPMMRGDEYDQLIADPDEFVNEVLVPRKYPWMFTSDDPMEGVRAIETMVNEQFYKGITLDPEMNKAAEEQYGVVQMADYWFMEIYPGYPAIDLIFDSLRGFRETLVDLRRQPDKVMQACEVLWEKRMKPSFDTPLEASFPYYASYPHIPTYLSPKQFGKYYWPQYLATIKRLNDAGNKMIICLEGSWMKFLDFFQDAPKDSCFMMVDEDDPIEMNSRIGDQQLMIGGMKLAMIHANSKEDNLAYARKVIDACAPGGGFIFGSDKTTIAAGDINQTYIDVYDFVHEYGRY